MNARIRAPLPERQDLSPFWKGGRFTGKVAGSLFAIRTKFADGLSCHALSRTHSATRRNVLVRRFATLGLALVLSIGTLVPVANAQQAGKTLVLGFSQEPDTMVAWEGGLYVSQVAANLVY